MPPWAYVGWWYDDDGRKLTGAIYAGRGPGPRFRAHSQYNYFPGWHQPFSATHLVVNLDVWRALPASYRALLDGLCTGAVTRSLGLSETLQGPVVAGFKDQS